MNLEKIKDIILSEIKNIVDTDKDQLIKAFEESSNIDTTNTVYKVSYYDKNRTTAVVATYDSRFSTIEFEVGKFYHERKSGSNFIFKYAPYKTITIY